MTGSITVLVLAVGAIFSRPLERVSTMDSAFAQSIYDSRAVQLVYETPLEIDYEARPYRLAAGFCELPEVSEDGKTYTFKVRGAAGKLNAYDMVRSLERLRDPKLVSPNAWIVKDVDTIAAPNERTVEIRLKCRVHYFPWLMAMSPAAVRGENGEGSGEFELTSWRKNHEMVFTRRKPVSGGFDTIRYLVVDDVSTQWLMFLKGELDFLGEISRDNLESILGIDGRLDPDLEKRGISLHTLASMDIMHIGFNMKDPVLGKNRKLRQALNCAFDYRSWERFYGGRIIPADGPVPPGVEGRLETPFAFGYDLEKARQLLAEAGYAGGVDPQTGRRLVLTMAIGRASQSSREQGELIASFFAQVGIKLELDFMTWDAFLKAVSEARVQMFSMGWVGDYPDAQNFLQLFHSKNVSPGPNHSGYVNVEFDREYDAAMASADEADRNAHWRRCQEIVREDCPWICTHYNRIYSLTGPKVGNYRPSVFPYGDERNYTVRHDR